MKPLDLERFEGATPGPWRVQPPDDEPYGDIIVERADYHRRICRLWLDDAPVRDYNEAQYKNARLIAAAPQLLAELKALRAWRQTINKAVEEGLYDENKVDMYKVILEAWNAAATELHDV